jgi:branched-chain amino acid transport system substrate-binding protein
MLNHRVMLALVAAMLIGAEAAPRAAEPIKIGIIHPYSGPLALVGVDATNGFTLFFDQAGYKVAGRDITLLKEDTAANPAQAMERTRRLIERERVNILTGITNSAVAYAVRGYVSAKEVPLVVMGSAGANDLTDKFAGPYIFRTSFTNRQLTGPFGQYACKTMGYKRIVVMTSDFVTGYEQGNAFEASYKKAGCEVVKVIRAPLGNSDFAPFLSQIPTSGVDAVWAMFFAADAIAFVKQYESFGLKDKIPLVAPAGTADQALLPGMGKAAVGLVSSNWYSPYLDNPENKKFAAAFKEKFHMLPGATAVSGYDAAMAIAKALEAVGGKVEDKPAFLAALRKVKMQTPMGAFRFDDKQNVIFDLYLMKVVERNGVVQQEIVGSEPMARDVDQYGNFK